MYGPKESETVSVIFSWIKRSFGIEAAPSADAAAEAVLLAAREPAFYLRLGVPDTFDGRFEVVALHTQLVLRRLKNEPDPELGQVLAQGIFDYLTGHFDEALREIGVGDMSVGKRMKAMASGLYGRLAAYDAGFQAEDGEVMADALRRNLYGTVDEAERRWIGSIIEYQQAAATHLNQMTVAEIQSGKNLFPSVAVPDREEMK